MIVIGDVHGCLKTLQELIAKFPTDQEICFVGDLIDRGPNSRQVVEFVRSNGYHCVKGNHEDMMRLAFEDETMCMAWWQNNGGRATLESYSEEIDGEMLQDFDAIETDIKWMNDLPLYLEFEVDIDGIKLVVSHSGIANIWDDLDQLDKTFQKDFILWNWDKPIEQPKGIYNIHGHTPCEGRIKSFYANIDTGCAYGKKLSAIQFPEMVIYEQENIE